MLNILSTKELTSLAQLSFMIDSQNLHRLLGGKIDRMDERRSKK